MTLSKAPTASGVEAPIVANDKGVTVGGAKVIKTDIEASNGVVHVVDTVMIP